MRALVAATFILFAMAFGDATAKPSLVQDASPSTTQAVATAAPAALQRAPVPIEISREKYVLEREVRAEQRDIVRLALEHKSADLATKQSIIGVIGIIGLAFTVHFARLAWKEAQGGAKAARDAAVSARLSLQSDRAWLTHDAYDATQIRDSEIEGVSISHGFGIRNCWRNTGRSPAVKVNLFGDFRVLPRGSPIPVFNYSDVEMNNSPSSTVGSGDQGFAAYSILNDDQYKDVLEERCVLYLYSAARYKDVYSSDYHVSESCFVVFWGGTKTRPDGFSEPALHLMAVGQQNSLT